VTSRRGPERTTGGRTRAPTKEGTSAPTALSQNKPAVAEALRYGESDNQEGAPRTTTSALGWSVANATRALGLMIGFGRCPLIIAVRASPSRCGGRQTVDFIEVGAKYSP
jgi:hypothetical protein